MRASRVLLQMALAVVFAASVAGSLATDSDYYKVADGVSIYLGVVPSEVLRAERDRYPPGMHGGTPTGPSWHHVMIALFDAKTGKRINDAKVTASVEEQGVSSQHKTLEPMVIAGTVTYGNFFSLGPNAVYRIHLRIELTGTSRVIETDLRYHHVHEGM